MFYLTTHSTHFIYSYMASETHNTKDGKCFINDALNTFYLRFYGVGNITGRKENVLFNDAPNTFYLRFYGVGNT